MHKCRDVSAKKKKKANKLCLIIPVDTEFEVYCWCLFCTGVFCLSQKKVRLSSWFSLLLFSINSDRTLLPECWLVLGYLSTCFLWMDNVDCHQNSELILRSAYIRSFIVTSALVFIWTAFLIRFRLHKDWSYLFLYFVLLVTNPCDNWTECYFCSKT